MNNSMLLRFDDNSNGQIDYEEFLGSEDRADVSKVWEVVIMMCT